MHMYNKRFHKQRLFDDYRNVRLLYTGNVVMFGLKNKQLALQVVREVLYSKKQYDTFLIVFNRKAT